MNGFIEKKDDLHNKNKNLFPTEKGKNVYPFIKRENDYSDKVALEGFTQEEADTILKLVQRVRKISKQTGSLSKRKQEKLLMI